MRILIYRSSFLMFLQMSVMVINSLLSFYIEVLVI